MRVLSTTRLAFARISAQRLSWGRPRKPVRPLPMIFTRRKIFLQLQLWSGLTVGLVLVVLSISGATLAAGSPT